MRGHRRNIPAAPPPNLSASTPEGAVAEEYGQRLTYIVQSRSTPEGVIGSSEASKKFVL